MAAKMVGVQEGAQSLLAGTELISNSAYCNDNQN
jgi:hypothetical protein